MKKNAETQHTAPALADASATPQQDGNALMQALLTKDATMQAAGPLPPIFGVVVGNIRSLSADGALLDIPALGFSNIAARIVCAPQGLIPGAAVAVVFEQGDVSRALIMGPMYAGSNDSPHKTAAPEMLVDHQRQRIVIEAGQELELRCGEAAIILTADGRILQRGTYISSHASATQRILGGSVQIN